MSENLRLFVAVDLDDAVKEQLEKIINILRDSSLGIKWVDKFNLHITLKFLGEINEDSLDELKKRLLKISNNIKPFSIEIKELGAFPNLDYPKVIWAGIDKGSNELIALQDEVESNLLDLGFKRDNHEYKPHITLGRTNRKEKKFDLISNRIKEFPFELNFKQKVNEIYLMKSKLTPKGPVYSRLLEVEF